jgi:cobyrinic acid a,c-diamide synthase
VSASAARGLIVAAPHSGSGKTVITLALARALRRRGLRIGVAKTGPDYVDPGFHAIAAGRACHTLDPWAMRETTLAWLIGAAASDVDLVLCEGAMGLFDGVDASGTASTADVAARTRWPVVLVIDARGMAASVAALVEGFARHRADTAIVGVILNRVGGENHRRVLAEALARVDPPVAVLGAVNRAAALDLPSRHLGLVPALEREGIESWIEHAASRIESGIDLDALIGLAKPAIGQAGRGLPPPVPPFGQRIALARDEAFAFGYPFVLEAWRLAGAEIHEFSPLADESPWNGCDAVFLPGGYPELHAGRLAAASRFRGGLRAAAERGAAIYGECGGYMALGRALIDARGIAHAMAGLLPVETSFAERRLQLGYREVRASGDGPLAAASVYRGHEFHYATILSEEGDHAMFTCRDARGKDLGRAGRRVGRVGGSFIHLIDRQ